MKFMLSWIVYILCFLVTFVISESGENKPCGCAIQDILGSEPSQRYSKPRYSNPFSPRSSRYDQLTPEEREERVNRGFARIMQFMTFLGHVDNYLTDKANGLIKIMGRATNTIEDEEYQTAYDRRRQTPRISTTITT